MKRTIAVVVGVGAEAEAFRGAVGLTLRGDAVTVVVDPAADVRGSERARATLAMFGHSVVGPEAMSAALEAHAIEVWGEWQTPVETSSEGVLHVVRPGRRAPTAGQVLHLEDLDDDQLLDHVLAAGAVAVW